MQFTIQIDSQVFHGTLLNNDAAKKFYELLPLTISMSELNQNEKYYYLDQKLPTNSYRPGKINMGDLMLFQSDCLVLFYQSFTTNYSYTRLGQVEGDLSFLSDQEEVEVTFTKESIS